jgi:hypothetical protein
MLCHRVNVAGPHQFAAVLQVNRGSWAITAVYTFPTVSFYYKSPDSGHRYALNGRTAAEKLNWMFKHILKRRPDLNKVDLKLVAAEDGVWMQNCKTGSRLYVMKTGKYFGWYEEAPLPQIADMHERYDIGQ